MDADIIWHYKAYNLFLVFWPASKTFVGGHPVGLSHLHENKNAVVLNLMFNFRNVDSLDAFNSLYTSYRPSIYKIYLEVLLKNQLTSLVGSCLTVYLLAYVRTV